MNLKPYSSQRIENICVDIYAPDKMKNSGVCLVLGLMLAVYEGPYQFDYLMVRSQWKNKGIEPLIYKKIEKLNLNEISKEIQQSMGGDIGSIYVQMDNQGEKIGIMLWNLKEEEVHTCSIAYQILEGEHKIENQIQGYLAQVYQAFLENEKILMRKVDKLKR
ncbi:UNVERIFIED_ORG: hypothetical protein B5F06_07065 [Lacrimispora saccharolytica]|nr:unknown [Clostridium sp. CAG:149]